MSLIAGGWDCGEGVKMRHWVNWGESKMRQLRLKREGNDNAIIKKDKT